MPARDRSGISRCDAEHVIEARVMGMIFDSVQGGFDTAPTSMRESAETAEIPDDLVVDRDDVVEIQQISDPSTRSARPDARK